MSLFQELKRRNVFRVGIAYLLVAWVILQAADFVLEVIDAPGWVLQVFVLAAALGLIAAIIFSWVFELTPEGIKREHEIDRSASVTPQTGRKLDRLIIGALLLVIVAMGAERFIGDRGGQPSSARSSAGSETASEEPDKSIAVLPFADLSQGRDQEWFGDGLAEEILNALAKTPDLLVASRTSAFKYKNSDQDIQAIARELGVAYVLEGSVRGGADRIRVTAQLIRAADGFHLWSQNYDRDPEDMISIQEDLAVAIAGALETSLDPEALDAMAQAGTASVDAYRAFLQGLTLRSQSAESIDEYEVNLKASYEAFERARALDPGFAEAHWEASFFWLSQLSPSRLSAGLSDAAPQEALGEFESRINAAISNAHSEDDRQLYRSLAAQVQLRLREAVELLTRYRESHPNDSGSVFGLLELAIDASNEPMIQQVLDEIRERSDRDIDFAGSYIDQAHRYGRAADASDLGLRWLERQPRDANLIYGTHRALLFDGRILEARELVDRLRRQTGEVPALMEGRQACAEGDRERVETLLTEVEGTTRNLSTRWQLHKFLGNEAASVEVLRPLERSGIPFQLSSFLSYPFFDPTPFPSLMAALEREGVNRPPATQIPFQCPPPEGTSIAVLPFVNMSADAENEFFSDGVSEEILNVLARVPELKVAARTSAFSFKGTNQPVGQIAETLGVNHVLEGSVRKAGNRVRVTAQLIKADDGFHLWSETYDRELDDIFAIQDEIAGEIAEALKLTLELTPGESGNLTGTTSLAAYEQYLQGMAQWHQRTPASLDAAIRSFERAIAIDPGFSKAWGGLALSWTVYPGYVNTDYHQTSRDAIEAAERALELDPENVEAMVAKANRLGSRGEYAASDELFEQAIALSPSYATAFQWFGRNRQFQGDGPGAIDRLNRALTLNPESRITGLNLAYAYAFNNQLDEMARLIRQVVVQFPDFPDAWAGHLVISLLDDNCPEVERAATIATRLLDKSPDLPARYLSLCKAEDPVDRSRLFGELLGEGEVDFSNPSTTHLMYDFEYWFLATEWEDWEHASKALSMAPANWMSAELGFMRNDRRPNAMMFNCSEAAQSLYREAGALPPAIDLPCD